MNKVRKMWKTKEVEKLRDLAKHYTSRQIAEMLDATHDQVKTKLRREGIKAARITVTVKGNEQLCWACKWATGLQGKCPWTHANPTPPEGCITKKVKNSSCETYHIIDCPLFEEG